MGCCDSRRFSWYTRGDHGLHSPETRRSSRRSHMERIFITLALDLTDTAPETPGWYLNVVQDGQRLMEPMPIPPETAYRLGQDIQSAMQDSRHELPNFLVSALVQAGNSFIY